MNKCIEIIHEIRSQYTRREEHMFITYEIHCDILYISVLKKIFESEALSL